MYSAIEGVGTECDTKESEEEATGGILVFFLLLIPLVTLHLVILVSIHAYIKVKAVSITFKTPPTDRKSTRLTPVTNAHLVCRLLLENKKETKNHPLIQLQNTIES